MASSASSADVLFEARGFGRARWKFRRGECWAVVGDASALCASLAGAPPPRGAEVVFADGVEGSVRRVSFAQQGEAVRARDGWLQARYYGSIESDFGEAEDVREFLSFEKSRGVNPFEVRRGLRGERRAFAREFREVAELFSLGPLLGRPLHALSNGEMRRVLLARAVLGKPELLVLEDPFSGLDPARRVQLGGILDSLAARGVSMLVAVSRADEVPSCATHVFGRAGARPSRGGGRGATALPNGRDGARPSRGGVGRDGLCPVRNEARPSRGGARPVVELRDINVSFGRRVLFKGFDWTVRQGERWVLAGPNGSGKTTLFALITGDSPLAYANDVTVFGQRRGSGRTLASVRRRIGMVSPEQQAYLGKGADELLDAALASEPDLLLLDEPCANLGAREAARLLRRVSSWLDRRPSCTAICIAHRPDDVPPGFELVMRLT